MLKDCLAVIDNWQYNLDPYFVLQGKWKFEGKASYFAQQPTQLTPTMLTSLPLCPVYSHMQHFMLLKYDTHPVILHNFFKWCMSYLDKYATFLDSTKPKGCLF
jgi:hypothetical protein